MCATKRVERLEGPRHEIKPTDGEFPSALRKIKYPPKRLYAIGCPEAMQEGLAVIGARKATPYGLGAAARFGGIAAKCGIAIISGGARGCDSASHRAALEHGAPTVVFLGGGCNAIYPSENGALFQEIVDKGGVVVSEHDWDEPPLPAYFRMRNRLIAGLAKATLIVEAGIPSGTLTTADEALEASREVLVVPGAITSESSHGANRLIYQGATPIIDDETFMDQLKAIFGIEQKSEKRSAAKKGMSALEKKLLSIVQSQEVTIDDLLEVVKESRPEGEALAWVMQWLGETQSAGLVSRYPNGRYGPNVE